MSQTNVARRSRGRLRDKLVTEERYVPEPVRNNLYRSAFILMAVGSLLFITLVVQVVNNVGIVNLDNRAETWFVSIRTQSLTTLGDVLAVVFGPVSLPIIILVLTVLWIIFAKHAWRPLVLAGAMALG